MINLNEKQGIKSFHGEANNSKSLNPFTIQKGEKIPLEVTDVTDCLTVCHDQCSGKYIDCTGKFLINCLCKCHDKNHTFAIKRGGNKN